MNSLPPELLYEILSYLPNSSRPSTRLTSHAFNAILAPTQFTSIPSFLNPDCATSKLEAGAREARRRNITSIWSPRCSVPDGLPIPQSFLLATYLALQGKQWRALPIKTQTNSREWDSDSGISLSDDETDGYADDQDLTFEKVVEELGRNDITEDSLRLAMFRYALYLSYSYPGPGEAPSLWVFDQKVWVDKQ